MGQLRTMDEEQTANPQLTLEDIKALRQWAQEQPHLPNIDDIPDIYLALFLRRRFYNLDKAKQTLDNFLTFRTQVPELSINRRICEPGIRNSFDTHFMIPLRRDSEGNLIIFVALREPEATKYNLEDAYKTGLATYDSWFLENGSCAGKTMVIDQQNLTIRHAMRMSVSTIRNIAYYNKECDTCSIKNLYIINANSFTQKLYTMLFPLVRRAAFQRIRSFSSSELDEFYKLVPKDSLPNEYGGKAGTLQECNEKSLQLIDRQRDIFDKMDALKVNESARPKKSKYLFFW